MFLSVGWERSRLIPGCQGQRSAQFYKEFYKDFSSIKTSSIKTSQECYVEESMLLKRIYFIYLLGFIKCDFILCYPAVTWGITFSQDFFGTTVNEQQPTRVDHHWKDLFLKKIEGKRVFQIRPKALGFQKVSLRIGLSFKGIVRCQVATVERPDRGRPGKCQDQTQRIEVWT